MIPPTAAPPSVPSPLPLVNTEPPIAPTPAPIAVFLSRFDMLEQEETDKAKTTANSTDDTLFNFIF